MMQLWPKVGYGVVRCGGVVLLVWRDVASRVDMWHKPAGLEVIADTKAKQLVKQQVGRDATSYTYMVYGGGLRTQVCVNVCLCVYMCLCALSAYVSVFVCV